MIGPRSPVFLGMAPNGRPVAFVWVSADSSDGEVMLKQTYTSIMIHM